MEIAVNVHDQLPEFADPTAVHRLLTASTDTLWDISEFESLWVGLNDASLASGVHDVLGGPEALAAEQLCQGHRPVVSSLRNLVEHPTPDVRLLTIAKDMAKALLCAPELSLPRPLLLLMYTLPIVVARSRYGRKISELPDAQLIETTLWLIRQEWVDPQTRRLLSGGLTALIRSQ